MRHRSSCRSSCFTMGRLAAILHTRGLDSNHNWNRNKNHCNTCIKVLRSEIRVTNCQESDLRNLVSVLWKWKWFLHDWPFVRRIHQSLVNLPHKGWVHPVTGGFPSQRVSAFSHWWIPLTKGQWCGPLIFSLMSAWATCWTNSWGVSYLRYYEGHVIPL